MTAVLEEITGTQGAPLPPTYLRLPTDIREKLTAMPPYILARLLAPPEKHQSPKELYRDACVMKRLQFSPWEMEQVLRARFGQYYRSITDREFEQAIKNADGSATGPRAPRWPKPNAKLIATVLRGAGGLERLRQLSPISNPETWNSSAIIDRLFSQDDLLCFAHDKYNAVTELRSWFSGKEQDMPLMVPNPMRAKTGMTKAGRLSAHSLDNTGPRVTQVVEFDTGTFDEQAKLILDIQSKKVALRMVVFSGSKSLHAWYDVRGWSVREWRKLCRYAAALGADTATFTRSQFVRTPNAHRETGQIQMVEYLS